MDCCEIIYVINYVGGYYCVGVVGIFFSRLENQFNDVIELGGILFEYMCQFQFDGGMVVMVVGVYYVGVVGGEMIVMGVVVVVMLFVEIEGIYIDVKGQGWFGLFGVECGYYVGEIVFKCWQLVFWCVLFVGVFESLGQGFFVWQFYLVVGIDDVVVQCQLIVQFVKNICDYIGGVKFQLVGFSVQVKIMVLLGYGGCQLVEVFIKLWYSLFCYK